MTLADDPGLGLSSLTRWVSQHQDDEAPVEARQDFQAEPRRLRKEDALLKQERDILKKAAALFAKETGKR